MTSEEADIWLCLPRFDFDHVNFHDGACRSSQLDLASRPSVLGLVQHSPSLLSSAIIRRLGHGHAHHHYLQLPYYMHLPSSPRTSSMRSTRVGVKTSTPQARRSPQPSRHFVRVPVPSRRPFTVDSERCRGHERESAPIRSTTTRSPYTWLDGWCVSISLLVFTPAHGPSILQEHGCRAYTAKRLGEAIFGVR